MQLAKSLCCKEMSPITAEKRIGLWSNWSRASYFLRQIPSSMALLLLGLSFPVGLEIGPVTVTLADIAIVWMAVSFIVQFVLRNQKIWLPLFGAWFLFLFGSFGSTIFSQQLGVSIVRLLETIEMCLIFFLVSNLIRRQEQIKGTLMAFVLCSMVNAAFALAQFAGLTEIGLEGRAFFGGAVQTRGTAFIGGSLGAFLGIAMLLLASWLLVYQKRWTRWMRTLGWTSLALLAGGLLATLNRTWLFATILGFLIIVLRLNWKSRSRLFFVAVVALCVLSLALNLHWFDWSGEKTTEFVRQRLLGFSERDFYRSLQSSRYTKWALAWEDFLGAPVFGVGMGVERFANPLGTWGLVDNHYLELLAEMGLVGTIGFLWIAAGGLVRGWKAVRLARSNVESFTALSMWSGLVIWLTGGILWGLFSSGKPGMMLIFFLAMIVKYQQVLAKKYRLALKGVL